MSYGQLPAYYKTLPDLVRILLPTFNHKPLRAPLLPSNRYWTPPTHEHFDLTTTLWGTLSQLMESARLNQLAHAKAHSSPSQWLQQIKNAANRLYLPPKVPASTVLFTDPATWHNGQVSALLDRTLPSWPQLAWPPGGHPAAILCWPVEQLSDCLLDLHDTQHLNPLTHITCPVFNNQAIEGPYLFFGLVTRQDNKWNCIDRCARPIAAIDFPVPVDTQHHRLATHTLHRLLCILRDNKDLALMLGGQLTIRIDKPLHELHMVGGPCAPDFLIDIHRPKETRRPRPTPRTLHPRDRVHYVVQLSGLDDPIYEQAKRTTQRGLNSIGKMFFMHAPDFFSDSNSIEYQREVITADIAIDVLKRWQRYHVRPKPQ